MSNLLGEPYRPSGRFDAARLLPLLAALSLLTLALADGWYRLEARFGAAPVAYALLLGMPLAMAAAAVLRWGRVRNRLVAAAVTLASVWALVALFHLLGLADAHRRGGGESPGLWTLLAELPEFVAFRARNQLGGTAGAAVRWAGLALELAILSALAWEVSAVAALPFHEASGRWYPVRRFAVPQGTAAAWHRHLTGQGEPPAGLPELAGRPRGTIRLAALPDAEPGYADLIDAEPDAKGRWRPVPLAKAASLPADAARRMALALAAGGAK